MVLMESLRVRSDVTFKDSRGRKYKWRGNAPGRSLEVRSPLLPSTSTYTNHTVRAQLFAEDDGFKEPIARFVRSRKETKSAAASPANLLLTARALEIRDDVVCSFLFLEKTRRVNETTQQRSSDVLSTPAFKSALTGHDCNVSNGGVP